MKLKKTDKILIISHYEIKSDKGSTVAADMVNFLLPKVGQINLIQLPFTYAPDKTAYCTIFKNGKKHNETKIKIKSKVEFIEYIEHAVAIWRFLAKTGFNFKLVIAFDNLSAITVYPLSIVNQIDFLVFYAIDYVPKRFQNKILNKIYYFVDQLAFGLSDRVWGVSERMLEKRTKNSMRKYNVVPIGIHLNRISPKSVNQINRYELVYMGSILEKQGLQIAIKSLPELHKKYPNLKLQVYGRGDYEHALKKLTRELKLDKQVKFHGYVKSHEKLEELISKGAIGIAPYIPDKDSFTYYADPSKLKQYIGAGLPVITTDISYFAEILEKNKAGVIMNYSQESFIKSVDYLLKNKKRLETYKKHAVKLSLNYDIEKIMNNAFRTI